MLAYCLMLFLSAFIFIKGMIFKYLYYSKVSVSGIFYMKHLPSLFPSPKTVQSLPRSLAS